MIILCLISFILLAVSCVHADVPADEILDIPGYGPPKTRQYSGFIPVDDKHTAYLHYWFVTSSNDPTKDPVTLWMNGGPSCSSMEGGLYELGPYTFLNKLNETNGVPMIIDNVNSWTTVSSVIFLESPAGVGFSYNVNGSMESDDYIQSQNTYGFMLNFFAAFPEFASNDFFVTGESYAGIYVPTLAERIVDGNKANKPFINLKGIAIGNGCWGNDVGACSDTNDADRYRFLTLYGHALIPQKMYQAVLQQCTSSFNTSDPACREIFNNASDVVGDIYSYDIYDTCDVPDPTQRQLRTRRNKFGDPVSCLSTQLAPLFLDHPLVRKAFHLDHSKLGNWSLCSTVFYGMVIPDTRPIHRKLIDNDLRVLIYSGDADIAVPWIGSYEWVRNMNYPVTRPWSSWIASTADQTQSWTGGYVTEYGNMTFLTVKHAGHLVPQYEPEAARSFYMRFIQNRMI